MTHIEVKTYEVNMLMGIKHIKASSCYGVLFDVKVLLHLQSCFSFRPEHLHEHIFMTLLVLSS